MQPLFKVIEKVNKLAGWLGGFCICAAALLIIAEIIIRSCFASTLYVADEFTGYLMAASSMLGLGYVEAVHGHIRMDLVDLLREKFPKLIRFLNYIAYIAAIIVALYLTWVSYKTFDQSFVNGSRSMQISETPLWIPQLFLPVGSALLFLQYCVNLVLFASGRSEK